MQMKRWKQSLSVLVCCVLIAATALCTTGCNGNTESSSTSAVESTVTSEVASEAASDNVLGEGETAFTFTVVDGDGNETAYEIHTDKATVGEALLELGLIDGEDGDYGLYVKTVNGVTVDYDTDGKYWAFYVDGEYAQTGVDSTEVTPGANYAFKVE